MATKNGQLSDLQLKQWTKAGKALAKSDGNGLTFTLSTAGKAVWILRYRFGGRRFELTLGSYPDLGLAEARARAVVKRADTFRGVNPVAEKHKAKAVAAKDWTMRQLINDYRIKKLAALAQSTQRSYGRHLKTVDRRLGTLTVREAEAGDIVALIEESKLTWLESNMMLVATKSVFTPACGKRLINANPCTGIMLSALLGPRPPKRQRLMLTRQELHLLLKAKMRRVNALAIRILLACGVRSAEFFTARWEDVHLDEARWHLPASKTGPAMDIPLVSTVVDWFEELRSHAKGSAYVMPARKQARVRQNGDTHVSKDTIREAIDSWIKYYNPEIRRFTPHDLRSTMKSHMRALGVLREISEMCLTTSCREWRGFTTSTAITENGEQRSRPGPASFWNAKRGHSDRKNAMDATEGGSR
jgi:integrase